MSNKSNRKIYEGWCKRCQSVRKYRLVGWNEDAELAWLRCSGCHSTYAFEINRLHRDGTLADPTPEEARGGRSSTGSVVEYDPRGTYNVGQKIRHPVFQDVGQVIAVERSGSAGKIVVDFETVGQKTLVAGRLLT